MKKIILAIIALVAAVSLTIYFTFDFSNHDYKKSIHHNSGEINQHSKNYYDHKVVTNMISGKPSLERDLIEKEIKQTYLCQDIYAKLIKNRYEYAAKNQFLILQAVSVYDEDFKGRGNNPLMISKMDNDLSMSTAKEIFKLYENFDSEVEKKDSCIVGLNQINSTLISLFGVNDEMTKLNKQYKKESEEIEIERKKIINASYVFLSKITGENINKNNFENSGTINLLKAFTGEDNSNTKFEDFFADLSKNKDSLNAYIHFFYDIASFDQKQWNLDIQKGTDISNKLISIYQERLKH